MTFGYNENEFSEQAAEWINYDFSLIHQSWRSIWGQSINSEMIRSSLENTPRFSDRFKSQILETSDIFLTMHLQDFNEMVFVQQDMIKQLEAFQVQIGNDLIFRTGLVYNSCLIKSLLAGPKHNELLKHIDKNLIRYALCFSSAQITGQTNEEKSLDMSKIHAKMKEDGTLVLLCWLFQLPKSITRRLILLLPKPEAESLKHIREMDKSKVCDIIGYTLNHATIS